MHVKHLRGVILQRICSMNIISDCLCHCMKHKVSRNEWFHAIPKPCHDHKVITPPLFFNIIWGFCMKKEGFREVINSNFFLALMYTLIDCAHKR